MANNLFDELIDWYRSVGGKVNISETEQLRNTLIKLGVLGQGEVIVTSKILEDWYQVSEDVFLTTASVDIECTDRVYTKYLAGYAIVSPPGIPIEEVICNWQTIASNLSKAGIKLPSELLIWNGTIYISYPPFNLVDYINENIDFYSGDELVELAKSLNKTFKGMMSCSLQPLGLKYNLRTDGFDVYYCGLNFDTGEILTNPNPELCRNYEQQVFELMNDNFIRLYKSIKDG